MIAESSKCFSRSSEYDLKKTANQSPPFLPELLIKGDEDYKQPVGIL